MSEKFPTAMPDPVRHRASFSLALRIGTGMLGLALLAASIGLWARHGSAVFFDLIASGIAYCF
ncbi:tellurite resistance protein TehA-like permease [Ancylobacter sp. 3268]|uniref:hypothetical protein n=1 Tax=Ancylobacter sp. 3268 TaxID=2817752 RepID=UPI002858EF4E|nr:hypothetical protein [Ancylobacter sp. 3268]MDR6952836.1 tellurite resistance protein TehA-like permease [Ancylobacter sp. 3268]